MDLTKIIQLQKELDNSIHHKHQVTYEQTFAHRKLALLVELGELANEVRSFKYWSLKPASDDTIILEEFVDCLHFTISLGLSMNIDFDSIDVNIISCNDVNLLFIDAFKAVSMLESTDIVSFENMFIHIISLITGLGFNYDQVLNSYLTKNIENHRRQNNNY